jgi:CheY-like chemotaxis protein
VDCAATLDEALSFIAQRSPDAILCDLNLAENGGGHLSGKLAAARLLGAMGNHKPAVIYMTGELIETPETPGSPAEPRHLQKPFRISEVIAMLQEIFAAAAADTTPK